MPSHKQTKSCSADSDPELSAMPKKKPQRKPSVAKLLKQTIDLHCVWDECSYNCNSMEVFNRHVAGHIPDYDERLLRGSLDWTEAMRCRWDDCDHVSAAWDELERHTLYHAFHRKLCEYGMQILAHTDAQLCKLSPEDLNVMPQLHEPFTCAWDNCMVEFNDPQGFYWHVGHHVACEMTLEFTVAKCLWEGCPVTSSFAHLKTHMRVHTREKMVACPVCGNVYASNQKFIDHCTRQIPLKDQRYQCTHCLKTYATESLLRNHVRQHINTHRCSQCPMTCANPGRLRLHVAFRHTTERPFPCQQCDKRFKTEFDANKHSQSHNTNRQCFACPVVACSYKAFDNDKLKKHFRIKHGNEPPQLYLCHLCDARFSTSTTMTKHLKEHHHLSVPDGHMRFSYKLGKDGHFHLQTLRYESLEVAQQMGLGGAGPPAAASANSSAGAEPDVLSLTCSGGDVPDTIHTDDGRELQLPDVVRQALGTGARVLVCVIGDQVELLGHTDSLQQLDDPDDPDALMLVVDSPTADEPMSQH